MNIEITTNIIITLNKRLVIMVTAILVTANITPAIPQSIFLTVVIPPYKHNIIVNQPL